MKILFLAHRVPFPPNKGDKLRSFNEIKFLSQAHEVHLACLTDRKSDCRYQDELRQYCRSVEIVYLPPIVSKLATLLALFSKSPLTLANFYSARLFGKVQEMIEKHSVDLIFIFCSSMAQYAEQIENIPKIIDFVDVDSEKWQQYSLYAHRPMRWIYQLESKRLRAYETMLARTCQHGFLVSAKETEDFQRIVSNALPLTPIVNGVDSDFFQPTREPYEPNNLVFTGAMDYFANVEAVLYFAREILPRIQRSVPKVKFVIVGSNPTKELIALAKSTPNITVTGYVDRVQPYVTGSSVFVAPMRIARGLQNKILESMAMGVPVVTSPLGYEGIIATPPRDLFVENEPEEFAAKVVLLIKDPVLRQQMATNGRLVIENSYQWTKNLAAMEPIITAQTSPPSPNLAGHRR